jgi:LPS O-antigen subunit length determinant protein (WzzB/FepE family)
MQIKYQAYSSVAAQLQAAEAKVQEATPAFTTLQMATVPVRKAGPRRSLIVIFFCFLAGIITCFYILYKEDYLIPLTRLALGMDGDEEESAKSE